MKPLKTDWVHYETSKFYHIWRKKMFDQHKIQQMVGKKIYPSLTHLSQTYTAPVLSSES